MLFICLLPSETFDLISQLEKYKTYCLINMPKQVSSVLIYALKNVLVKQICKRDSKLLSQAIAATPCINQANGEITKCYTKFIDSVLGAKNAVETKRIPHLCWYYIIINLLIEFYHLVNIFQRILQTFPMFPREDNAIQ